MRNRRKRIRRALSYALIMICGGIALFLGAAVVSVNGHNRVSTQRIVLFDMERADNGTVVTFMGKEYVFAPIGHKPSENAPENAVPQRETDPD